MQAAETRTDEQDTCVDWCEDSHDDDEPCRSERDGVTRYQEDGSHVLFGLVDDEREPEVQLDVVDGDDNEAQLRLTLAEVAQLRDRLTALLVKAGQ